MITLRKVRRLARYRLTINDSMSPVAIEVILTETHLAKMINQGINVLIRAQHVKGKKR